MTDPPAWAARFAPLRSDPTHSAVLADFDGTLAEIVSTPAAARLVDGAAAVLAALGGSYGTVAVISGRPASFLADQLVGVSGVRLVGSYGAEWVDASGSVVTDPTIEPWREVVAVAARQLRAELPMEVLVEDKGVSLTVHWRRAPGHRDRVLTAVTAAAGRSGLVTHGGRQAVELRPPRPVDKGSVVAELAREATGACYLGDDVGDLPAFAALDRIAADTGAAVVKVAVASDECPPEVGAAADVLVEGPIGALRVLQFLAGTEA